MEVAEARIGSRQKCAPPWMRLRSRVAVPSCGAPARTKPARSAARAHELRTGESYTVIVTTGGGLWRYRLGDLVEVDGFIGATRSLRFLGRGASVSDLCGEKLAETFATSAIAAACASCACTPHFALLAPEHDPAGRWSYTLFAEGKLPYELPARLDAELRANPHCARTPSRRHQATGAFSTQRLARALCHKFLRALPGPLPSGLRLRLSAENLRASCRT